MPVDRRAAGVVLLVIASAVAGWLERRPPRWIASDPLVSPFGLPAVADPVAALDSILDPPRPEPPAPRVVDPNRATREEWIALPGVGPATADRILEWREQGRPFRRPEDLEQVWGIGPARVEQLRPWLEFPVVPGDSSTVRHTER